MISRQRRGKPRQVAFDRSHPLSQGLVGAWLFNEGGGTIVRDLLRRKDATLQNTASPWNVYGVLLDGSNDYLSSSCPVSAPPFTVAAIVRPNTFATNGRAIWSLSDSTQSTDQHALLISKNGGGQAGDDLSAMSRASDGVFASGTSTQNLTVDTWAHCVGVWATASLRTAYVNGGNGGSNTSSKTPTLDDTMNIGRLGDSTPNWEFGGDIESLMIWERALSVVQVQQHYRDPYAMFRRPVNWTYAEQVAAGGDPEGPLIGTGKLINTGLLTRRLVG